MKLHELVSEMSPVVYSNKGISMKIYFKDTEKHHEPHVHVWYQGAETILRIPDGVELVKASNFPKQQLGLARRIIQDNESFYIEKWNEFNPEILIKE